MLQVDAPLACGDCSSRRRQSPVGNCDDDYEEANWSSLSVN